MPTHEDAPRIEVVVACGARDGGFARRGAIPWSIPPDLRRFRRLTLGHPVIMGRVTWETLPGGVPLKGRRNIVVSASLAAAGGAAAGGGAEVCASLPDALDRVAGAHARAFVIGGQELYLEALLHPRCAAVHVTQVVSPHVPGCDRFFPTGAALDALGYELVRTDGPHEEDDCRWGYSFLTYERRDARAPYS